MTGPANLRVAVVGFRHPHFAEFSGYQKIAENIPGAQWIDGARLPWGDTAMGTLGRRFNLLTLDAWTVLLRGVDLCHYINPENSLFFSNRARPDRLACATIHQPGGWIRQRGLLRNIRANAIRSLDGVITLSREAQSQWSEQLPGRPVSFIPHGVENLAAHPDGPGLDLLVDGTANFLVIGGHLRDPVKCEAVIRECAQAAPDWRFHLVGTGHAFEARTASLPNVISHAERLDDRTYASLLGNATGLFLPLLDATANNALLEAQAMGTPAVVSDTTGTRDYVVEGSQTFAEVEEAVSALAELATEGEAAMQARGEKVREAMQPFLWENLVPRVLGFYEQVAVTRA